MVAGQWTLIFCFDLVREIQNYFQGVLLEGLVKTLEGILWLYFDLFLPNWFEYVIGPLFSVQFFYGFNNLLNIVDFLENSFSVFAGTRPVVYNGQTTHLLNIFFSYGPVRTAFWGLSTIGIVLTFLFTIFSVVKSMGDLGGENKKPVGKILLSAGKSMISFLIIPAIVFFGINLTSIVFRQVEEAASGSSTSMTGIVFVATTMNAAKDEKMNGDAASFNDSIRSKYLDNNKKLYQRIDKVKDDFEIHKLEIVLGYICAWFLIIVFYLTAYQFIRRMLDLLLLYILSPIFVAFIPLDDGKKFSAWRELFIGKAFSGFGVIIIMKVFLMIMPMLFGPNIKFNSSPSADVIIKLFFMLGGFYAAYKGQSLLLSIFSPEAARAEDASLNTVLGITKTAAGVAFGVAMAGISTAVSVAGLLVPGAGQVAGVATSAAASAATNAATGAMQAGANAVAQGAGALKDSGQKF